MPNCISDFSDYIEVQSLTETADGYGGKTVAHTTKAYIWGQVSDTGGGEVDTAGRIETEKRIDILTRWRDDIVVTDRLLLDGIYYNIKYLENVDRKSEYLRILADSDRY